MKGSAGLGGRKQDIDVGQTIQIQMQIQVKIEQCKARQSTHTARGIKAVRICYTMRDTKTHPAVNGTPEDGPETTHNQVRGGEGVLLRQGKRHSSRATALVRLLPRTANMVRGKAQPGAMHHLVCVFRVV